jgi:hypothetical protein
MAALLPKTPARQFDAMSVVNQSVEDGVGVGWIADDVVPAVHRKLARHKGGAAAIALLKDFQPVLPGFGAEALKPEVIEDEKIGAAEHTQQASMPAVASGESKIGEQFWNAAVENGPVVAACFVAKRAGKLAFAGSCFADDGKVVVGLEPIAFAKLVEQRPVETAGAAVIDILKTGLMFQRRVSQPRRKTLLLSGCHFTIEQEAEPFGMAEPLCLLGGVKAFESLGHAGKAKRAQLIEGRVGKHS